MPGSNAPKVEVIVSSTGEFLGVRLAEERTKEAKLIDINPKKAHELLFSPDASMGPYTDMLEHLGIAKRSEVEATAHRLYQKQTMNSDSTVGSWRHAIKEQYRRRVEERLFDPTLSDAESYRQLRDAVDLLANKDRANLVEGWYKARRLQGMDVKAQAEYSVTRTSGPETGHTETRQADFLVGKDKVKGKEIVEIKDIDGKIDEDQFGAYADALHDDKVRATFGAERMRYVFTKEAGAAANLEYLADSYQRHRLDGLLTIEVFGRDGAVHVASNKAEAMELLKNLRNP